MSGRNGLAVVPGKPRILHVVPRTTTYTLENADGETATLAGYHKGPTCPVPVSIEVDRVWEEWEASQLTEEEREAMRPRALLAKLNMVTRVLRRDLLMAVIPGLEMDAVNVLAADDGAWEAILAELGWWIVDDAKDTADPEATAPAETNTAPTGAASSPDFQPPTQALIS